MSSPLQTKANPIRAGTRSPFSHYLPRLKREFYQADAVVFWTIPIANRATGWLNPNFHSAFRETMFHAAFRESLLCPAYCLMPDHIHFVWMGLEPDSDQLNGIKFLRAQLGPSLKPAVFQHQAYDHVLSIQECQLNAFSLACGEYVLDNPQKAGLVKKNSDWPYLGAVIPGYPRLNPISDDFWPWLWKHYYERLNPEVNKRTLPPREMM